MWLQTFTKEMERWRPHWYQAIGTRGTPMKTSITCKITWLSKHTHPHMPYLLSTCCVGHSTKYFRYIILFEPY